MGRIIEEKVEYVKLFILRKKRKKKPDNYCHWVELIGCFYGLFCSSHVRAVSKIKKIDMPAGISVVCQGVSVSDTTPILGHLRSVGAY